MATREDALLAAAATVILFAQQRQRGRYRRRFWMRPTLREKNSGERNNILNELMRDDVGLLPGQLGDSASFSNFFRMSKADFEHILNIIGPTITKVKSRLRKPISSTDRLPSLNYCG